MTDDVRLVIAADNELVAADVADVLHARRICLYVIGCAAAQADTATGHTLLDDFVRHLESQCAVDACDLVESLSLRDRAREAVKDEAALAVALCDALLEQVDDELIRYELAGVHVLLSRLAKGRIVLDCLAQNVAGGDARNAHLFDEVGCERALAGAGCAKKNQIHLKSASSFIPKSPCDDA